MKLGFWHHKWIEFWEKKNCHGCLEFCLTEKLSHFSGLLAHALLNALTSMFKHHTVLPRIYTETVAKGGPCSLSTSLCCLDCLDPDGKFLFQKLEIRLCILWDKIVITKTVQMFVHDLVLHVDQTERTVSVGLTFIFRKCPVWQALSVFLVTNVVNNNFL